MADSFGFQIDIEQARQIGITGIVAGPEPRWWFTHRIGTMRFTEVEADGPMSGGDPVIQGSEFNANTSLFNKPNIEAVRFQDVAIKDFRTTK